MKKHILIILLTIMVVVVALVACSRAKSAIIEIETPSFVVSGKGERVKVMYNVENPASSSKISAVSPEPWITDIDVSREGLVEFNMKPNDSPDGRKANLVIKYEYEDRNGITQTTSSVVSIIQKGVL